MNQSEAKKVNVGILVKQVPSGIFQAEKGGAISWRIRRQTNPRMSPFGAQT
jgi:hypothetical protein